MNRGKKPLSAQQKKKQAKETRAPLQPTEPEQVTKSKGTWKILEKFPKNIATKSQPEVTASEKKVAAKKKKLHSKHSKRTTPGEVERDITPYAHRHPEGKKVHKNLDSQSTGKARSLSKKLSKSKK